MAGVLLLLHLAGRKAAHGLYGRETRRHAERQDGGAVSRQEFLRRHLAGHHRGTDGSRLPCDRRRPDRLLQIEQARALSVQLSAACRQHPRTARFARHLTRDHHRAFDGRHARHALRADLCRRRRAACAGQSDRPRGLEGEGRAVAKHRRLVSAGAENDGRQHPRLSARDLLCRHLGRQIRALGADAGRASIAVPDAISLPGTRR